jgi:hypothetical protein
MFEIAAAGPQEANAIAHAISDKGVAATCVVGARIKVFRPVEELMDFIDDLNAAIADGQAAEAGRRARQAQARVVPAERLQRGDVIHRGTVHRIVLLADPCFVKVVVRKTSGTLMSVTARADEGFVVR